MNITKENIDDLNAVIKLSIEKQDYEATVSETLKDYRKKANMPGFRVGKVPAGMIKKMYGKSILADEVNKILSKELTKYIFDNNLNILGEPLPNEEKQPSIDWDKDENFEFVYDIGMSPEFELILDKRNKLPYYEIKIDDELVDKQIEGYTNRFGENIPAEEIGEKETTKGNFVQIDADGNVVENGIVAENVLVSVELIKDDAVKKSFIGSKKGDVITFNPKPAFENDQEVAHMLNIEHEKAEGLDSNFTFTINEINKFQAAEINEELFKKIYGEETEIKTVDEFRNKIGDELKENLKYSSEYRLLFDAKETLSNKVGMKLPEAFLKRWLLATNENITEEQVETDFEHFRKDLEWSLIKSKIVKDNEIKVEDSDIREAAREMAMMQFRQYGMFNVPDEHLDNYADSIQQNEEEKRKLAEKKMEDKVVAFIKEKVTLETKESTQEEFDKLFEKQ
jgi:trigger factor